MIDLDALQARLDEILSAFDRSDRPGIAVAVIYDGDLVARVGYGNREGEIR